MRLPKGVAIIRAQEGSRRVVMVSDRLTHDQELCARVMATVIAAETGQAFVLLRMVDVMAAITAAAQTLPIAAQANP